ncbi:FliK [Fictibacillus macauensis ZFHKF-1]|uniref:FliK n=1 Tax=Fictibacillus macauensis ZFHKF-1 TaxID=1196324 RepID=I8J017_9BACL|nr:flagellar hook-length control protein FliK [Fictibacillus macauensis]EIT85086.1 FliK [Fictibacillus macauensis ZFHKF-1]
MELANGVEVLFRKQAIPVTTKKEENASLLASFHSSLQAATSKEEEQEQSGTFEEEAQRVIEACNEWLEEISHLSDGERMQAFEEYSALFFSSQKGGDTNPVTSDDQPLTAVQEKALHVFQLLAGLHQQYSGYERGNQWRQEMVHSQESTVNDILTQMQRSLTQLMDQSGRTEEKNAKGVLLSEMLRTFLEQETVRLQAPKQEATIMLDALREARLPRFVKEMEGGNNLNSVISEETNEEKQLSMSRLRDKLSIEALSRSFSSLSGPAVMTEKAVTNEQRIFLAMMKGETEVNRASSQENKGIGAVSTTVDLAGQLTSSSDQEPFFSEKILQEKAGLSTLRDERLTDFSMPRVLSMEGVALGRINRDESSSSPLLRTVLRDLQQWTMQQHMNAEIGEPLTALRIRLTPEALGTLSIEMMKENGKLFAKIVTTSSGAKELVEANIHVLKSAFQESGTRISEVVVQEETGTTPQPFNDHRSKQEHRENQEQREERKVETDFLHVLMETTQEESDI